MKKRKKGGRKQGDSGAKNGANGRRRPNHSGTLEKRGGKWRARWTSYTPQGEQVRMSKTLSATNVADARKELAELTGKGGLMSAENDLKRIQERLGGVRAELARLEDEKPALAIADGFSAYKKSTLRPDSGARTLADYAGYYKALVLWLQKNRPDLVELRHVAKTDAEAYAADFKCSHSAGTYNKRIVFFRCMWRVLAESEEARLTCNPWVKIQTLSNAATFTRRELTVEEMIRVIGSAEGEMRLLFAIGVYTGLRLGDSALLDWGAVDMLRGKIEIIPRKTARHSNGKPVVIPLHPVLAGLLAKIPSTARQGYVLPEIAKAYEREPSLLTRRIQRHFSDCGISTQKSQGEGRKALTAVGFHSLRHTFVSMAANAGAPLALVQSIAGHSNPAMTRHYYHAELKALTNAVTALPVLLSGTIDVESTTSSLRNEDDKKTVDEQPPVTTAALQALYDAFDALSPQERKQAKLWISQRS
ncbi:MAG: site-specific integrase [Kiritimatiellae bacterium]|nr:site-specific integrase [Kiritimatiellia bacterium]